MLHTNGTTDLSWTWPNEDPEDFQIQRRLIGDSAWTNIQIIGGVFREVDDIGEPVAFQYRIFGRDSGHVNITGFSNVVEVAAT